MTTPTYAQQFDGSDVELGRRVRIFAALENATGWNRPLWWFDPTEGTVDQLARNFEAEKHSHYGKDV